MAIAPLTVDSLLGAALAPILGVIVFWFIQLIFIEIQKRIFIKLYYHHEAFCRFTNYIGILFQMICQSLGYTVTRSGIASFNVTVSYGKVQPKKEKTGVLKWIAKSFLLFGPFFVPGGLVLLLSYFAIHKGFVFPMLIQYTFIESLTGFGMSLYIFSSELFTFLLNIDLFNPIHIGFLMLLLFLGLGIRPSYIGQEEKVNIIHDLKQIIHHLIEKPLYIFVITIFIYLFYLLSLFLNPIVYIGFFSIFGWISIIAIIAIFITYPILIMIKITEEIRTYWKLILYIIPMLSYIFTRVFFIYFPINQDESISLLVLILSTVFITILFRKYKRTNRFKTIPKMKHMRIVDGKKRTFKK